MHVAVHTLSVHSNITKMLLEHNANPDARDAYGQTCIGYVMKDYTRQPYTMAKVAHYVTV